MGIGEMDRRGLHTQLQYNSQPRKRSSSASATHVDSSDRPASTQQHYLVQQSGFNRFGQHQLEKFELHGRIGQGKETDLHRGLKGGKFVPYRVATNYGNIL
ncbi:hypothetical protein WR25_09272 [Diploscapter pachys]|uniref:Uncharacterized protein n=1 Tax=Diploscapter pachys TaxID=2018661 RepID=A0A2A2KW31_9BILA|nr:hypothetical protein WR25_09272 [Diploscapter pachys]